MPASQKFSAFPTGHIVEIFDETVKLIKTGVEWQKAYNDAFYQVKAKYEDQLALDLENNGGYYASQEKEELVLK